MRALLVPLVSVVFAAVVVVPAAADAVFCPGEACAADVSITASGTPSKVYLGDMGELTWTVTNAGPLAAGDVFFGTNLQAGLTIGSAQSDVGSCHMTPGANGNVDCTLGTIAVGQSVAVRARYRALQVGSGQLLAHAYPESTTDRNQTNNAVSPELSVAAPAGGIAKVRAATSPERILKTGGVSLRITPAVAAAFAIDGTITTPKGPVSLTHVDLPAPIARHSQKVFLGTTPAALSKIRRALRSAKHLRVRITIAAGGAKSTTVLSVQA